MQFTKAVEQAICTLILLATQESNTPLSADELSKKLEVSPSYMKKITRKLVVKDIISSVPGHNGGITLAKKLSEIRMIDVIEAIEGPISLYPDYGLLQKTFQGGLYTERGVAVFHQVFSRADQLLIDYFTTVTAEQLVEQVFNKHERPSLDWTKTSLSSFLNHKNRGES